MARQHTARSTWSGDLQNGSGKFTLGSGAASDVGLTWKARAEEGAGSSPEELIAAALAGCYSMALSNILAKGGNTPDRIDTEAVSTFQMTDAGPRLTNIDMTVRGSVPGIDDAAFKQAAEAARTGCPVSNALKGNVEIRVDASLA